MWDVGMWGRGRPNEERSSYLTGTTAVASHRAAPSQSIESEFQSSLSLSLPPLCVYENVGCTCTWRRLRPLEPRVCPQPAAHRHSAQTIVSNLASRAGQVSLLACLPSLTWRALPSPFRHPTHPRQFGKHVFGTLQVCQTFLPTVSQTD